MSLLYRLLCGLVRVLDRLAESNFFTPQAGESGDPALNGRPIVYPESRWRAGRRVSAGSPETGPPKAQAAATTRADLAVPMPGVSLDETCVPARREQRPAFVADLGGEDR
jgi:hypothetical protein